MDLGAGARQTVSAPRIVGIVLVRNEDLLVGRALRNAAAFADEWILCDHGSTDNTLRILEAEAPLLAAARVQRLRHPRESHDLIRNFAGQDVWIFGLDGDEIYDPAGLERLRTRLRGGDFKEDWMVLGNVLHVTGMAPDRATVSGHLAPPCRSMTKLYNFSAIDAWDGYCAERLHGGSPRFRPGYDESRKRNLHEVTPWETSDFRCLHMCFQPRSSRGGDAARPNIMELYGPSRRWSWWRALRRGLGLSSDARWKYERYRRGDEVTVPAAAFFTQN
jgi:glycosyltransferase involved in cell wall biosynthesis